LSLANNTCAESRRDSAYRMTRAPTSRSPRTHTTSGRSSFAHSWQDRGASRSRRPVPPLPPPGRRVPRTASIGALSPARIKTSAPAIDVASLLMLRSSVCGIEGRAANGSRAGNDLQGRMRSRSDPQVAWAPLAARGIRDSEETPGKFEVGRHRL
jgi:hypothetical protein